MRMELERRNFCRLAIWLPALFVVRSRIDARESRNDPPAGAIDRQAVDSTHLASIGYHAPSRVLEVEFRSGAIYRYFAVPPATFAEFMRANSKGRHFAQHIRDRFEFLRMEARRP